MQALFHTEKLRFLRDRLTRTNGKAECQRIVNLIEAEELKYQECIVPLSPHSETVRSDPG